MPGDEDGNTVARRHARRSPPVRRTDLDVVHVREALGRTALRRDDEVDRDVVHLPQAHLPRVDVVDHPLDLDPLRPGREQPERDADQVLERHTENAPDAVTHLGVIDDVRLIARERLDERVTGR